MLTIASAIREQPNRAPKEMAAGFVRVSQWADADPVAVTVVVTVTVDVGSDDPEIESGSGGKFGETTCTPVPT